MHSTWSELPGTGAPSLARVYDVALGGKDNFEVDRQLFRRLTEVYPEYRAYAVANRHFLVHAVQRVAGSIASNASAERRSASKLSLPPSQ